MNSATISILLLSVGLSFGAAANPVFAPRLDVVTGGEQQNPDLIQVKGGGDPCAKLKPTVVKVLGAKLANCYMKLFLKESTCNPTLPQKKGQAGNPHAGYGVCTLERSPSIRRQNKRGPDCVDISSVVNQIKCCRAIMRKTPHYFGPVNRGQVPRCG